MLQLMIRLLRENRAVAMIEFAFAAPVLIFLLFGSIEMANFVYVDQKTKNAGYNVLNLLNTQENLRLHNLATITNIVPEVVRPYQINNNDYDIVVTVLQHDLALPGNYNKPYIFWQWPESGAGFSRFKWAGQSSKPKDNTITLAQMNNYDFIPGDQLVAVELRMVYRPYFNSSFTRGILNMLGDELTFFGTARPRKGLFAISPYSFN